MFENRNNRLAQYEYDDDDKSERCLCEFGVDRMFPGEVHPLYQSEAAPQTVNHRLHRRRDEVEFSRRINAHRSVAYLPGTTLKGHARPYVRGRIFDSYGVHSET